MPKNKHLGKIVMKDGKIVELPKDFFLYSLIEAIEQSEGIYSDDTHKMVVIGTLRMLFFKFQLADYMAEMEVTEADYSRWFEKLAIENNVDKLLYNQLFGKDKDGK